MEFPQEQVLHCGTQRLNETSNTSDKLVADHHKLKREMEKFAMSKRLEQEQVFEAKNGLVCVGADGKRDRKTLIEETVEVNGVLTLKRRTGVERSIKPTQQS